MLCLALQADAVALWFTDEAAATATYDVLPQWDLEVTSLDRFFDLTGRGLDESAYNMTLYANLTGSNQFGDMTGFVQFDLNNWDVGSVTSAAGLFDGATTFSSYLFDWDTGSITDMSNMLKNAGEFNRDLANWARRRVSNLCVAFPLPPV